MYEVYHVQQANSESYAQSSNKPLINIISISYYQSTLGSTTYLTIMQSRRLQTDLQPVRQLLRLPHLRHEGTMPLLQIPSQLQSEGLEGIVTVQLADLSALCVRKGLRILLVRTSQEITRFRPLFGSTCGTAILGFRYSAFSFTDLSGERLQTTQCNISNSFPLVFLMDLIEASVVLLRMSGDSGSVSAMPSLPFLDLLLSPFSQVGSLILGNSSGSSSEFFLTGICRLFFLKLILFLASLLIFYLHLNQNSRFRFYSTCSNFQFRPTRPYSCFRLSQVERAPDDACFFSGRRGELGSGKFLGLISLPMLSLSWTKGTNWVGSGCTWKPLREVLMKWVGE